MARPLRINLPGASYHVFCRGNRKDLIFFSDRDRYVFIEKLNETCAKYEFILFAVCLMPNHYHLYLRISKPNLSAGIQYLNTGFSNWLKAKHQIVGHVFQGRFKSILVDDAEYAAFLSAYIHLNPVEAGVCKKPDQFRWSSYLDLTARRKGFFPSLDRAYILRLFHENEGKAITFYEKYVMDLGPGIELKQRVAQGIVLGDDDFVRKVRAEINQAGNRREHAAELRREGNPKTLQEILDVVTSILSENNGLTRFPRDLDKPEEGEGLLSEGLSSRNLLSKKESKKFLRLSRDLFLYLAKINTGYTLKEIGTTMNMDYSAVFEAVKRFERRIQVDHVIRMLVQRAEEILGVRSQSKMLKIET